MLEFKCPICNSELKQSRTPEWDKELRIYAKFFCRCDKCNADVTIDHGVVTMIDKNGLIQLSGK